MTNYLNKPEKVQRLTNGGTKQANYSIKPNDRVFICGKTGSGKSTLAQYLLYPTNRLIVIDGKDGINNTKWNLKDFEKSDLRDIRARENFRIRLVNNQEQIIETLNAVYASAEEGSPSVTIYIDEVTATIEPKTKEPSIYRDIWTRGRSKNIGAWANTQRPTLIPLIFLSEAEHIFTFTLNLDNDRKRVSEIAGKQVLNKPIDKYGFYYYNLDNNVLKYYKQINI